MRSILRSTLLASSALALSFVLVGCDDAAKPTTPPPASTPPPAASSNAEPTKGGAMEGAPKAPDTAAPAPTPAPTPEPEKKDMPK